MKVLIGDDHQLFRDGLRLQLRAFDEKIDVLDATDFPQVFERLREFENVGLILIDLGMPGMPWQEALANLAQTYPSVPVVVVSATDEPSTILKTLNLGVVGYIPKTSSGEVMINALRLVLAGGVYLPMEVLTRVSRQGRTDRNGESPGSNSSELPHLTARQKDVLNLMAKGKSNKEIAADLELADGTVKTHTSALLRILGVNNRTQAILRAIELGLLQNP